VSVVFRLRRRCPQRRHSVVMNEAERFEYKPWSSGLLKQGKDIDTELWLVPALSPAV
jgi:hypothetical protein